MRLQMGNRHVFFVFFFFLVSPDMERSCSEILSCLWFVPGKRRLLQKPQNSSRLCPGSPAAPKRSLADVDRTFIGLSLWFLGLFLF